MKELIDTFNEKQLIMIKDHLDEILYIYESIRKTNRRIKLAAACYYVIKKYNIPISSSVIFKNLKVKLSSVNLALSKINLKVPIYSSLDKIKGYCKYFKMFKNFDEKIVIEICKNVIEKESNVLNELTLVCAVLFKLRFFKETELSEITGLTDVSIRNYRRILNGFSFT